MHFVKRNERGTGTSSAVNTATDTRSRRSDETAEPTTGSGNNADTKSGRASGSARDKSGRTTLVSSDANTRTEPRDDRSGFANCSARAFARTGDPAIRAKAVATGTESPAFGR